MFGLRRTVCDGCKPYKPTRFQRAAVYGYLGGFILWLFPLTALLAREGHDTALIGVLFTTAAVTAPLQIAIHETGHALAAIARGRFVQSVELGEGPAIVSWQMDQTRILVGRYCFYGGLTRYIELDDRDDLWGDLLILTAGVLTNFLIGGLLLVGVWLASDVHEDSKFLMAMLAGFGGCQILLGLFNLVPQKGRPTREFPNGLGSDGLRIVQRLLRRPEPVRGRPRQAIRVMRLDAMGLHERAAQAALNTPPDSAYRLWYWMQALHQRAHGSDSSLALETFRRLAGRIEAARQGGAPVDREVMPTLLANVAWIIAKSGATDLDEVAETYSRAAIEAKPKSPDARAARGAWLAVRGKPLAGARLMTRAIRTIEAPWERADLAGFLAETWQALGDTERAKGFRDLQAHTAAQV